MASLIKRLIGKFTAKPSQEKWENIEYFDEKWKNRIGLMASYIPKDSRSVLDIGCGQMWLKEFIPVTCEYFGIDYKYRGEGSAAYDLNKHEFPTGKKYDTAFISGCLEYINEPDWLIRQVSDHCNTCVISYCITDVFSNIEERRQLTWVNDLSDNDIKNLFSKHGWSLIETTQTPTQNYIYVFQQNKEK
jgi:hypothetical protein